MNILSSLSKKDKIYIIENININIPENFDLYILHDLYKYDNIFLVKNFFNKMGKIITRNNSKLILFSIFPQQIDNYWYTLFLPILNKKLKNNLISLDIITDLIYLYGLKIINISNINKIENIDDNFYFDIKNLDNEIIYENDPIIRLINKKEIIELKQILIKKKLEKRINLLKNIKDLFGFKLGITIGK